MHENISGCLFGTAFGDALAADTEFLSVKAILSRYPHGPQDLQGHPALVTDDTQMALAVGKALTEAKRPYTAMTLEEPLRRAFVDWSKSPDNNRAPGITCMGACAKLASGMPWQQATGINSKGCGANMRVAPVGLLGGISQATRAAIAQFQVITVYPRLTATDFGKNSLGNQRVRQQLRQGSPIPTDTPEFVAEKILAAALHEPDEQYMDWSGTP